jgi:YidC/Oxa1 family membrane protein insertase
MKFGSYLKQEWRELERFDKSSDEDRSIVFYVENESYTIYLKSLIDGLINEHGLKISYVTSSKTDPLLKSSNENISSFYIGDGIARTKFFINLRAEILVTTTPDLETFHIKRSKVHQVHYVHVLHSLNSTHFSYRKNAFDYFDTIFCAGSYHVNEIRETEKKYGLKGKKLVEYGYGRLDELLQIVKNRDLKKNSGDERKIILVAPSWGNNGLIEANGECIVQTLLDFGYDVILRPHPMTLKKSQKIIQNIDKKFKRNPNFKLETNIQNIDSFFFCDCMISDWSGVAIEYAFALEKPVLYVDTPQKMVNPDANNIEIVPLEKRIRAEIGYIISLSELSKIPSKIENLWLNSAQIKSQIQKIRGETVFNIGNAGSVGSKYLVKLLKKNTKF